MPVSLLTRSLTALWLSIPSSSPFVEVRRYPRGNRCTKSYFLSVSNRFLSCFCLQKQDKNMFLSCLHGNTTSLDPVFTLFFIHPVFHSLFFPSHCVFLLFWGDLKIFWSLLCYFLTVFFGLRIFLKPAVLFSDCFLWLRNFVKLAVLFSNCFFRLRIFLKPVVLFAGWFCNFPLNPAVLFSEICTK